MPPRAIDFHVHLPTPDWLDGSMAGYVEAAEAYFRSSVTRQSLGELAALYRGLEVTAVLLAWDAETATGRPRVPNETVAAACRDYPDVFTGLGSVDPHKGEAAVAEVENIAALGLTDVIPKPMKGPHPFTYWDYRAGAFPKDQGMRIDLFYASQAVVSRVTGAYVDREARKGKGPSDHAPVVVDLD